MIVCALCENNQEAGDACDVCGRPFPRDEAVPVAVPPTEGLEPTAYAGVAVVEERLPELEPTHHGEVHLGAEPATSIEPTAQAAVEVESTPLEDFEPTLAGIPGDEATPFPALVTCRYCRNPASPGERLCAHCGMRLPVAAVESPAAAAAAAAAALRICGCGAPLRGPVCPVCGARAV
jgi:hypothetical protein